MFTSDVWRSIGLLEYLEKQKIPFIALDMPYGAKSKCSPHSRDPDKNVNVVYEAVHGVFGKVKPVIVGASLGGYIALKYSVRHPVRGLLLIAPVHVFEDELLSKYKEWSFPVHIIYGTKDDVVSIDSMKKLASLIKKSKLIIYEDAKHPAYLTYPERFRDDLLNLYREIQSVD